jgi:hypothetical protein
MSMVRATSAPMDCPRGSEDGSVLILALVFLLVGALIIGSLASWTTTNLANTTKFKNEGALLYAAGGATQVAMWSARYSYPINTKPTGYPCPGSNPAILINGRYIADWCVTTPNINLTITRQLVMTACLMTSAASLTQSCASVPALRTNALLTAIVDFDDNTSSTKANENCIPTNPVNCGANMTILSWKAQQALSS